MVNLSLICFETLPYRNHSQNTHGAWQSLDFTPLKHLPVVPKVQLCLGALLVPSMD